MFKKVLTAMLAVVTAASTIMTVPAGTAYAAESTGVQLKTSVTGDYVTAGESFQATTTVSGVTGKIRYVWIAPDYDLQTIQDTASIRIAARAETASINDTDRKTITVRVYRDGDGSGVVTDDELIDANFVGSASVGLIVRAVAVDAGFDAEGVAILANLNIGEAVTIKAAYSPGAVTGGVPVATDQSIIVGTANQVTFALAGTSYGDILTLKDNRNGTVTLTGKKTGTAFIETRYGTQPVRTWQVNVSDKVGITSFTISPEQIVLGYNEKLTTQSAVTVTASYAPTTGISYTSEDIIWTFYHRDATGRKTPVVVDRWAERTHTIEDQTEGAVYAVTVSADMKSATFRSVLGTQLTTKPITYDVQLGNLTRTGQISIGTGSSSGSGSGSGSGTISPETGATVRDVDGTVYTVMVDGTVRLDKAGDIGKNYVVGTV
ncbi:MAG: hypothetical protein IJT34_08830, partial [Butyrivibrio sp.]|nr:hypothetical protein [Butyrivibrio sp.]